MPEPNAVPAPAAAGQGAGQEESSTTTTIISVLKVRFCWIHLRRLKCWPLTVVRVQQMFIGWVIMQASEFLHFGATWCCLTRGLQSPGTSLRNQQYLSCQHLRPAELSSMIRSPVCQVQKL